MDTEQEHEIKVEREIKRIHIGDYEVSVGSFIQIKDNEDKKKSYRVLSFEEDGDNLYVNVGVTRCSTDKHYSVIYTSLGKERINVKDIKYYEQN